MNNAVYYNMVQRALPTLKPQKSGQMGGKLKQTGTFLNFLYITIDRFLQKYLLVKIETVPIK